MTTRFKDHILAAGTLAARPAATAVPAGSLYPATDTNITYRSDGTAWATWATGGDLAAHLADAGDAHDASAISVVPTGGIAATDVQAALAELDTEKAATSRRGAIAKRTTDLSIPSATSTIISWQATDEDTSAFWSSGSPTRLTVPTGGGGLYLLSAALNYTAAIDSGVRVFLTFTKSGAIFPGSRHEFAGSGITGSEPSISGTTLIRLVAGDYVEVAVYHGSSTARSVWSLFSTFQLVQMGT